MTQTMQPRDRFIPWYFVLFFVVIVLVDAVMVTLAVRTHTGTVTQHPYEKGLAYNTVVEAQNKQDALGWKGDIAYADGVLRFTLYDQNKKPIEPDSASVSVMRPTQEGMDFEVSLKDSVASVKFPASGLWELRVDAQYQAMHYQQSKGIVVP
jgi:nitrogen fixation protein FixH